MTTVEFLPVHQIRRPIDLRLAGSAGTSLDGSARIALVAAAVSVPPVALLHLEATGPVEPATTRVTSPAWEPRAVGLPSMPAISMS